MKKTGLFILLLTIGCIVFPQRSPAPLAIRPEEGASYTAPGSEEVPNQKDAQSQFDAALAREAKGDIGGALANYKKTVRRFPKSAVAPTAQYKLGELLEKRGNLSGAATAYELLIKNYPHSTDFNKALEGEYRIGTAYKEGAKPKILGVSTLPQRDRAVAIFTIITRNAPFSRLSPLAQFSIGQTHAQQEQYKDAINAYQVVVDKYPTDPIAADAMYQIGYCYMVVSKGKSYDRMASTRAREAYEDFVSAYPNNEKVPQARQNMESLTGQQTGGSLQIADYYYKQQQYRAAVVYYNDVIRQQPSSPDSEKAKARLDGIRAKYGEKYFASTPVEGARTVTPKLGDGRLQAQTDTAKRPDYAGPPVAAPTPVPTPTPAPAYTTDSGPAPSRPAAEPTPPPVPPADQPTLPAQ